VALVLLAAAPAAAETIIIRARVVHPVSAPPIEGGVVVVRDGRIARVGSAGVGEAPAEEGARVIEVDGVLVPGLIDAASDIGVAGRAAEEFRELTPEMRVADGIDLEHPAFARASRSGVTAVAVTAGARNVIGGLGVVLRTAVPGTASGSAGALPGLAPRTPPGARAAPLFLAEDAFLDVSLSEDAASGNANLRFARPSSYVYRLPNTRMGTVFLLRRAFLEALRPQAGGAAGGAAAADELEPLAGALAEMLSAEGREALRRSLAGKPTLRVWADYHQEVLSALRIMEEFDIKMQIVGAGEAAKSIPELLERRIPVILYAGTDFRESALEEYPRYTARLPALLAEAGVPFAFSSHRGDDVEHLRGRVAMSLRFGLSEEKALEALTLGAARILGVDGEVGSIEPGKGADLVAFTASPFAVTAEVEWVMIAGSIVHEREGARSATTSRSRSF
jgi:imidazolonepropionase-like amidohydrolase